MRLRDRNASVVLLASILGATPSGAAEPPCPAAPTLPAYAHNDYENRAPLLDALRLGYRGVEADVFLVEGELRVAHDRKHTRPGRTLESLYLGPLRTTVVRCGAAVFAPGRFLLNVEIKEESRATYDTLCAVLRRHSDVLAVVDHGVERPGAIEVVLVGWHPPLEAMEREPLRLVGVQHQVVGRSGAVDSSAVVRLVSLNYGKTIQRSGGWPLSPAGRGWLDALQRAKRAGPGRIARVYNVPPRASTYRVLFDSGIDLIGTEDLAATRRALGAAAAERKQ